MRRETYNEIQRLVCYAQSALDKIMANLNTVPFDPEPEPKPVAERWIIEAHFGEDGWERSRNTDTSGEFSSKKAAEEAFQEYTNEYTNDLPYRARRVS